MLESKKNAIPAALKAQWTDLAYGTVPDAQTAELYELTESVWDLNPLYQLWSQTAVVPCFRQMYQDWVQRHIKIERYHKLWSQHPHQAPKLRIGATDILHGTPKVFEEKAFSLGVLTATGSLEDSIGLTEIKDGSKLDDYIDGGWAVNPPLKALLHCDLDEIWLIEVFPHNWPSKPRSPMESKSRRDELWQCALLNQELDFIEKVNEWCKDKAWAKQHGYRNVIVRRMRNESDLMIGSVFVNDPSFIAKMMDFGYRNAATLFDKPVPETSPFSEEARLETPLTWVIRNANALSQCYSNSIGL